MKKVIPVIIFVVFLIIVPLLTWLNLRKGLDYRLENRKELVVKDSIDINRDTLHLFPKRINIIVTKSFSRTKDFVSSINEHFGKEQSVNMYSPVFLHDSIHVLPAGYLDGLISKYSDQTFILMDTSGYVRHIYTDNASDISKLIEHTSVLIPEKKRATIGLKREIIKADD